VIDGYTYPYSYGGGNLVLTGNAISGNDSLMVAAFSMANSGTYHVEWGLPVKLINGIEATEGVTLTVDPGVVVRCGTNFIKFGELGSYPSTGKLIANGAMNRPGFSGDLVS
jgi:hypothetical protein